MEKGITYKIYPTLLNAYSDYLRSSEIYHEYWGFSDTPDKTEDEFSDEQFRSLIDKINRVPLVDREAADRGTAFNEVVDCMISGNKSDKMQIEKVFEQFAYDKFNSEKEKRGAEIGNTNNVIAIKVTYNNRIFEFPINICREFANYFKGAISQVYTEAVLPTKYGNVLLYGFIDELMPDCAHDIKLTGKYKAYKFRHGWQHLVYTYCLNKSGSDIRQFEYNIAVLNGTKAESYTEYYNYSEDRDIPVLIDVTERFIEFLESNRNLITDKKIFNKQ
jgi:hypothetical protein